MGLMRTIPAVFIGGVLVVVLILAWKVSRDSGKSIPRALPDVPREAKKVFTDTKTRTMDAVQAGRETVHKTEAAIKGRFTGQGEGV